MSDREGLSLALVVPVYNSGDGLMALYEKISAALLSSDYSWRLVLIDDCSADNSWEVIARLAHGNDNVSGIRLSRNLGQHRAIFVGLSEVEADIYVTMDDDLQHNPKDIPTLLAALNQTVNLVYGRFSDRKHPLWKRLGSAFNDRTSAFLIKKPRGLYLSPFRAFQRNVRDALVSYRGESIYIDGLLLQATGGIREVAVEHSPRQYGESAYGFRKSASLWLAMVLGFSLSPLRLASLLGVFFSFVGLLGAGYVVLSTLGSDTPPGWASLLVAVTFLGGLQLLSLGIIGEYLGRVAVTVLNPNNHPIGDRLNLD
jgi:undecaprenyl-phosphate 4-deoxy-4-formamido-L-arabinose transferase